MMTRGFGKWWWVVCFQAWIARGASFSMGSPPPSNNHQHKIPPPPPLSLPVWSLACKSHCDDPAHSMNIVTFCTGISVAPPKLYAVSLYYDTLTKDSFLRNGRGILQLLRPPHKQLVPILGKQSGYNVSHSKPEECEKLGFPWHTFREFRVLPDCGTYLVLRLIDTMPAGDHLLAVCEVEETLEWNGDGIVSRRGEQTNAAVAREPPLDQTNVLYTGLLRDEGIL